LPEWTSWFALAEAALREVSAEVWAGTGVSVHASRPVSAPILWRTVLPVDGRRARRWIRSLLEHAGVRAGATRPGGLEALDPLAYLEAAVCQDADRIAAIGAEAGMSAERLIALGGFVAMPALHACRRSLETSLPPHWTQGYCPLCGGWPALAEIRGLERERHLRCARCGAGWRIDWLRCPFCGQGDHTRFEALLPDADGETRKVETCLGCRGYVKTVASLQAWLPEQVLIEDVATIDLDAAALGRGFTRPARPGADIGVRLAPRDAGWQEGLARLRRWIGWPVG
jgi:FdhE protein